MKITVTIGEIIDNYNWEIFCKIKGYSEYCVGEGAANYEDEIKLTKEEFKTIGGKV